MEKSLAGGGVSSGCGSVVECLFSLCKTPDFILGGGEMFIVNPSVAPACIQPFSSSYACSITLTILGPHDSPGDISGLVSTHYSVSL